MAKLPTPDLLTYLHNQPPATTPDGRTPARVGIDAVSRHHPAFVQLYYAVEARRTSAMPLVVQFISSTATAGASTVACGYARVAADDCSKAVLYIDCNATSVRGRRDQEPIEQQRPTLVDAIRQGMSPREALIPARETKNLLWARLGGGERPLLALGGDRLQSMLDTLREEHPIIVLDTPSAESPEAVAVSRYCDGSVLVVTAGRTRQWEIENAKAMLDRLGGQTVGVVLNRERSVVPRWLSRR